MPETVPLGSSPPAAFISFLRNAPSGPDYQLPTVPRSTRGVQNTHLTPASRAADRRGVRFEWWASLHDTSELFIEQAPSAATLTN